MLARPVQRNDLGRCLVVLVWAALVGLSGCRWLAPSDPYERVGVTASGADGSFEILYRFCTSRERVETFAVMRAGEGAGAPLSEENTLWRIDAVDADGERVDRVAYGEVPPGFSETVPAPALQDLPREAVADVKLTNWGARLGFARDELEQGVVEWPGGEIAEEDFFTEIPCP